MKRRWEVTYRLPSTGSKYHKAIVEAENQVYANRVFEGIYTTAIRCGGARAI